MCDVWCGVCAPLWCWQVRTAFIAGVLLCVALIPVNRALAQRIQVRPGLAFAPGPPVWCTVVVLE